MATVNEKMTAIADAIRGKTDRTDQLSLDDMATEIPEVYEAGKKSQYDEFWDGFQNGGNRTSYPYAFAHWTMDIFKPKYDIKPNSSVAMLFAYSKLTDIAQRLKDCGVTLDTSKATAFSEFASYTATITHLPEISTVSATTLNAIFYTCLVITIDKLILKDDGSQTFSLSSFSTMGNLRDIVIEGKFGVNVSFANSKNLTRDSLLGRIATEEQKAENKNIFEFNGNKYYGGIFGALKDGVSCNITLSNTAWNLFSEDEKSAISAILSEKGWGLTA